MSLLNELPKHLTENRARIEAQFVFCLWKNPDLFDEYIDEVKPMQDLLDIDGIFYFVLGAGLYKQGVRTFDPASVDTYLADKAQLAAQYEQRGDYDPIYEMTSLVSVENLESYYDQLVKSNALIALHKEGYDTVALMDKVREMTYEQLEDFMEYKLNNIFMKSTSTGMNIADLTSSYESWLQKWDSGVGVGYPIGFKMMNYQLAGIHRKNLILHLGSIGQGKAQTLDSKILTPTGYVEMRDIKLGDEIYGDDGGIHRVTGVYPQGKKDVFRVTFNDNTSTVTCDEHLWNIRDAEEKLKDKPYRTVTLKDIIDDGYYVRRGKNQHKAHTKFIPLTHSLKMENKDVPLDPYQLALLLGDGGLSDNSIKITFNVNEVDLIEAAKSYYESLGMEFNIHDQKNNGVTYRIAKINADKLNKVKTVLIDLGLFKTVSDTKFIPKEYLFNSEDVRLAMLQGLIDSDGEVNNSNYTFSTVSEQLKEDVLFLVQSLGGTARIENRQTYYTYKGEKKAGKPSYRLHIKLPNSIKGFRSKKHESKFKIGQREAFRCITNIEYIGQEECQCISTSNPTKLYLTDNMIVTHNTTSAINMYVLPVLEADESICVIANEQDEEQFRQMILSTVLFNRINYRNMNRQKFLFGGFTEEDRIHIQKAIDWLAQYKNKLHYVHLTDYGTTNVKRIIKKYAKLGVGIFLVDTLKPTDESSDKSWAEFSETAKTLFQLAQKEDVAVIATAQLSSEAAKRKYLDLSCIGKSRAIAETAGQVIMFRPLRENEKEKLFVYTYQKINGKWSNIKKQIQLDKDKDYVVFFIAKNRYGAGDVQIVCERNMSFNYYKEIGYCNIEFDGFEKKK